MAGFEVAAAASQTSLLSSLSFKLPESSQYIQRRRDVIWYPTGSSTVNPQGNSVVRFLIAGSDWLALDEMLIEFTIRNLDSSKNLYPNSDGDDTGESLNGGPYVFWQRARLFCGGELVDDVLYFNHCEHMIRQMMPQHVKYNHDALGYVGIPNYGSAVLMTSTPATISYIAPNNTYTAMFRPMSLGLVRSGKLWPNWASTLQLELTLANVTDCCGNNTGRSQSFELQNIRCRIPTVTLDSQLQDSYQNTLLQGKSFQIATTNYFNQFYALAKGQTDVWIPISRALSRLKLSFAKFDCNNSGDPTRMYYPDFGLSGSQYTTAFHGALDDGDIKTQLQVGSLLFPEVPNEGISEHYRSLLQALGLLDATWKSTSIGGIEFRRFGFIIASLLAKVESGWATGLNLQSGSQLRYQLAGLPASNNVTGMYISLVGDCVTEISEKGCSWYT
jgi:hypothetical protein